MVYLVLSILSSTAIFVVFKLIDRYKVFTLSAILVNYIAACIAGFFLSNTNPFTLSAVYSNWFPTAIIIGILFIVMFNIIGKSTQTAGVAVTSVAAKMSVIFPIAFSIWYDTNDSLTLLKIAGILIALFAVYLTVYQKHTVKFNPKTILLPVTLFIGMGIVDSFLKFAQSTYVSNDINPIFSTWVFAFAGLSGLLVVFVNRSAAKGLISIKTWLFGLVLGVINFGTMFFLIKALNHVDISTGQQAMGSVVFGIINIGIVSLGVIIGFIAFKERPSVVNWVGIGLSIFAIFILSLASQQ
jgi:drug/metabolite transporter (DMT)-like permease